MNPTLRDSRKIQQIEDMIKKESDKIKSEVADKYLEKKKK